MRRKQHESEAAQDYCEAIAELLDDGVEARVGRIAERFGLSHVTVSRVVRRLAAAGFVEARRHGQHRWVTAAVDLVDFKAPVLVGDIVNFYTHVVREGTKSVSVGIEVEAERFSTGSTVRVTSATMTLVAVDAQGKPIEFRSPPTV